MWDGGVRPVLNGFALFGVDDNGSEWLCNAFDGLFDGAASTLSTSQKMWGDGFFANRANRAGRVFTLSGALANDETQALMASWDALKRSLLLESQELVFTWNGVERLALVRQSDQPILTWKGDRLAEWSVQLTSLSPFLFTPGSRVSGSTALPASVGGMLFPYVFEGGGSPNSWQFPEETVSGMVSLSNGGTAESAVSLRIDGPCVNPGVEHVQSGKRMMLRLSLGTGHYVTFDGESHEVLIDGSDPARGAVVRREWASALPGGNTWAFSADSGSAGALLTVGFREAWL